MQAADSDRMATLTGVRPHLQLVAPVCLWQSVFAIFEIAATDCYMYFLHDCAISIDSYSSVYKFIIHNFLFSG